MTERQPGACVVSAGPSFVSTGKMDGMGRTGRISSLKVVIERLEGHLNAVVGSLWVVVATLGRLEPATQGVVLSGQAVWAKLVGLLGIVQEQ